MNHMTLESPMAPSLNVLPISPRSPKSTITPPPHLPTNFDQKKYKWAMEKNEPLS